MSGQIPHGSDVLSNKARRLLAELALTLATDDVYTANQEDQLAKLNPAQQREYLAPSEDHYAQEILLAVIDAQQTLRAEPRDGPMDWLAWTLAPHLLRRTFGRRT